MDYLVALVQGIYFFVAKRVISPVQLGDAMIGLILIGWWLVSIVYS